MPAGGGAGGGRAIMQSVVSTSAAIDAAFCSASRVTLAKQRKIRAALSNSFGFGGTNASLVLKSV